jgi:hypothetical protein
MTTLLFYKNVIPLDRDQHKTLKLRPVDNIGFAAEVTAVPAVVGEFQEIARQGPIAFLKLGDGGLIPVALLGLPGGRNAYLDADLRWNAPYMPAFIRRYPFVFSENGDQMTVCFDRDFAGFNDDEGEALFENGEPTMFLKNAMNLLGEFQRQVQLTQQFTKRLEEAGVLSEINAEIRLEDGRTSNISGVLVVEESKLKAISDATLKSWFDAGDLACIYAHRFSLGHMVDMARRSAPPAAPAA